MSARISSFRASICEWKIAGKRDDLERQYQDLNRKLEGGAEKGASKGTKEGAKEGVQQGLEAIFQKMSLDRGG